MMIDAADPNAPKYWMCETSGVLRPAIEAYLTTPERMSGTQVAAVRAYLRQWINSPVWKGPGLFELRRLIDHIHTPRDITSWLCLAAEEGHDPL